MSKLTDQDYVVMVQYDQWSDEQAACILANLHPDKVKSEHSGLGTYVSRWPEGYEEAELRYKQIKSWFRWDHPHTIFIYIDKALQEGLTLAKALTDQIKIKFERFYLNNPEEAIQYAKLMSLCKIESDDLSSLSNSNMSKQALEKLCAVLLCALVDEEFNFSDKLKKASLEAKISALKTTLIAKIIADNYCNSLQIYNAKIGFESVKKALLPILKSVIKEKDLERLGFITKNIVPGKLK